MYLSVWIFWKKKQSCNLFQLLHVTLLASLALCWYFDDILKWLFGTCLETNIKCEISMIKSSWDEGSLPFNIIHAQAYQQVAAACSAMPVICQTSAHFGMESEPGPVTLVIYRAEFTMGHREDRENWGKIRNKEWQNMKSMKHVIPLRYISWQNSFFSLILAGNAFYQIWLRRCPP